MQRISASLASSGRGAAVKNMAPAETGAGIDLLYLSIMGNKGAFRCCIGWSLCLVHFPLRHFYTILPWNYIGLYLYMIRLSHPVLASLFGFACPEAHKLRKEDHAKNVVKCICNTRA